MLPNRREALKLVAALPAAAACATTDRPSALAAPVVLGARPLPTGAAPWPTPDPFLFCVHHDDRYPAGTAQLGPPPEALAGREHGRDFAGRDGWRMYHGAIVPGFPQHPHRGFETITVVRRGLLDHSDSLGATARYGRGDVQWLTAGGGILHAEMFPLLDPVAPNRTELFQIWLNLPRADKLVPAHFTMLWQPAIPHHVVHDTRGRTTEVTVVAGRYGETAPGTPPPSSWAARPDTDVAVWTLKLAPGARFTLPAAQRGSSRWLYFFAGRDLRIGASAVGARQAIELRADAAVDLEAGNTEIELLMLQGRPIGEPVVQQGPFVMTTRDEIRATIADYQRTRFGGWKWSSAEPVHAREQGRFAQFADGRVERPPA